MVVCVLLVSPKCVFITKDCPTAKHYIKTQEFQNNKVVQTNELFLFGQKVDMNFDLSFCNTRWFRFIQQNL